MALLDQPRPPSLGSQLWVTSLINVNVYYLSEFVNDTGEVSLTASPRYWLIVTNRQYVDVKMAIRSFGDPQTPTRNLANIDTNFCTDIFHSNIKAGKIRAVCRRKTVLEELLPLKA